MKENEVIVRTNGSSASPALHETEDFSVPDADIIETAEAYLVLVDLPGAAKEQITLKIDQNELSIHAPVQPYHPPDVRLVHRELNTCGYHRRFTIGDGIDLASIDAHYEQGVLSVKLFKSEKRKPREININ
jgi:HSP20 family protein